jgi:hypothetical protein
LGIVVKKKKKNREENSCPADKEKKRKGVETQEGASHC